MRKAAGSPTQDDLPPSSGSWSRRLQHVHLRTKIVVPMVALAVIPMSATGALTIWRMRSSLRERAIERLEFDVASKAREVDGFLRGIRRDLVFLAQTSAIRALASAAAPGSAEGRISRDRVASQFLVFSQGKRAYYQLRYLSAEGQELVRLNVADGAPALVPAGQLQNKSDRYYVSAALALDPGQVYTSPMDLNVEHGTVEDPPRAVVRYATPVPGSDATSRGILVINVYADYLFSLVGPLPAGAEAWLVSADGRYLGFVGASVQRRELFGFERRRSLSADFAPQLAETILRDREQPTTLEQSEALYSIARVAADSHPPAWTLMIAHPRAPLLAPIRQLTLALSAALALSVIFSGALGILVGHYVTRPLTKLRGATRQIAAGDLTQRVEITTGDEIEGLANDFNAMTAQLREAQERLSAWNEDLAREVSRQTDHLHRLQSGLARADKLASLGQMTASVTHEIGNPLAAIKTKIQVAEEEGAICRDCQGLTSELLDEVDRLTAFLRSFSRFSRLREAQIEAVSLTEVVRGVKTLVGPELRSQGVELRVEVADDLPAIEGDANQLRQLLINLVLNAAQASTARGEVRMIAATTEDALGARVEVEDHGVGMPPETLERIWEPFFTTKAAGTGLGLAICRQIVEDHRGSIEIASQPGVGTTVTLAFPASKRDEGATGPRLEA